jgi:hypothetical protein
VFRRDNNKVTSLAGIKDLLRYNNFDHDPLANVWENGLLIEYGTYNTIIIGQPFVAIMFSIRFDA